MESETQPRLAKRDTKPLSVIIGALLVPLSAVAAYALTAPLSDPEVPTPVNTEAPSLAVATAPALSDIEEACGPAGNALVNAEADATITAVQQAALDALRDICDGQGLPLPSVAPPDGTGLVVQNSNPAPAPAPSVSQNQDDDHHDDDHDEDHDDDDHEEDD